MVGCFVFALETISMLLNLLKREAQSVADIPGAFANPSPGPSVTGAMAPRLRDAVLSRDYKRRLREAAADLFNRVGRCGGKLFRNSPARVIDRWLEKAVEDAHRSGERLYYVTLGVLGMQRLWRLSGSTLPGTWAALKAWRHLAPSRSRLPITFYTLQSFLLVCLAKGYQVQGRARYLWWSVMVGSWLSFAALLRPGEVYNLRFEDVTLPVEGAEGSDSPGMVIVIRRPKTRRVYKTQFVLVKDDAMMKWMRWWRDAHHKGKRLFPWERHQWANVFKAGMEALQLDGVGFSPASMRAGGATHVFREKENLAALQYLGRWSKASTLRHYLHDAFSMYTTMHFTDRAVELQSFVVMTERVVLALRELADALEELQVESPWLWEGQASQSRPVAAPQRAQSLVTPASAGREPCGSSVQYHSDLRLYLVLANPKQPANVGLFRGQWKTLEASLEGGRLSGSSARLRRVPDEATAAECLRTALTQAASALGNEEIAQGLTAAEVLASDDGTQSAARWRSGPEGRRLTAVLARLSQGLASVFPSLGPAVERGGAPAEPLQPVHARPLRGGVDVAGAASALSPWRQRLSVLLSRLNVKTLGLLLLVMMFPRLLAFLVAMSVRIVASLLMRLSGRILKELLTQMALLAADLESQIIEWLYNAWVESQAQTTTTVALSSSPSSQPSAEPGPPQTVTVALPARPVDNLTLFLLLFQVLRSWPSGWAPGSFVPPLYLQDPFRPLCNLGDRCSDSSFQRIRDELHRAAGLCAANSELKHLFEPWAPCNGSAHDDRD
ncbi:hypothetical protein AK812_SmicGene1219 [Symbiodinium microadriaticum]|uniref:Tyr recombinase domain-containing protein n=1 Tax=Symbiodinium microadriaticum TaxID=2951 RepID=A0A1Q9F4H7_SYMMI|nr:hypothetical protein AK812_SmicGene1219 [Symbiodinium microadriaticum]